MVIFPFIQIENKKYPSVIMGEDNFTGWFDKGKFNSEEERAKDYLETLQTAYKLGVKGFSISPQKTLMQVLKKFKKDKPDIVCIANPHWKSNYYLNNKSLWDKDNLAKLNSTIAFKIPSLEKNCYWFNNVDINNRFSDKEIKDFKLDEDEYKRNLKEFKQFCDFSLVGNLGRSALTILGREDIIKKEIFLTRKEGLAPLGMCEAGGFVLKNMEKLDIAGTWVWINKHFAFPSLKETIIQIRKAKKPITAYKIFASPKGFDFKESIEFIKSLPEIKSIVVGVENKEQAKQTFSKLERYFGK